MSELWMLLGATGSISCYQHKAALQFWPCVQSSLVRTLDTSSMTEENIYFLCHTTDVINIWQCICHFFLFYGMDESFGFCASFLDERTQ